jgi:NAD(P)-dependent dehydrogenase (short-subunit alcohol dehydrogenase family)
VSRNEGKKIVDLQLKGKIAVVTGGSKGIGLAIVRALVAEGAEVTVAARTEFPELAEFGGAVTWAGVDLATRHGAQQLAGRVGEAGILVNNLGGAIEPSLRAGDFLGIDDDAWQQTFELNLFSAVRVTRALLPRLLRQRGVVINISSVSGRELCGPADYGAAKAALTYLGKVLAEQYGARGLRALTVTPGIVGTQRVTDPGGLFGPAARAAGEEFAEFLAKLPERMGITVGRLAEPEEIAALVTFLASPLAGSLTGAEYLADGGIIKAV